MKYLPQTAFLIASIVLSMLLSCEKQSVDSSSALQIGKKEQSIRDFISLMNSDATAKNGDDTMDKEEALWLLEAGINYSKNFWVPDPNDFSNLERMEGELQIEILDGLITVENVQSYYNQLSQVIPNGDVVYSVDLEIDDSSSEKKLKFNICYDTNQFPGTTFNGDDPYLNYLFNGFCQDDYWPYWDEVDPVNTYQYCNGPLSGQDLPLLGGGANLVERLINNYLYGQRKLTQQNYYYTDQISIYPGVEYGENQDPLPNPYDEIPGDQHLDFLRFHVYGAEPWNDPKACLDPEELLFYRDVGLLEYAEYYRPEGKQLMSINLGNLYSQFAGYYGWSIRLDYASPNEYSASPDGI